MRLTATALRQDLDRLLDQVLDSGEPIEIERKGRVLRIVADQAPAKLCSLRPDPGFLLAEPDSIISVDWAAGWNAEPPE